MTSFGIVIPTFKRVQLINSLLDDLKSQCSYPQLIIVVDGDPASNLVQESLLKRKDREFSLYYLPSNHANLSYQRYLGWLVISKMGLDFLLYLDDDLRIFQPDAIEKLFSPLVEMPEAVGSTGVIRMGEMDNKFSEYPMLKNVHDGPIRRWLTDRFGNSREVLPGHLTPTGDRILPVIDPNQPYVEVHWLRGGVMAYRLSALRKNCFSVDLFSLDHIRCGKGEDTFLSRNVMRNGKLFHVQTAVFDHPNSDFPKTYPISSMRFGYARAYSRRFLNDHYRMDEPPLFADRLALIKSYLGNNLINISQATIHPRRYRFAYAWGYFRGSVRGLLQKPTARNLCPNIDWWKDAEEAVNQCVALP